MARVTRLTVLTMGKEFLCCQFILMLCKLSLTSSIVILRKKFSPGPGFKPRSPALRASALTN